MKAKISPRITLENRTRLEEIIPLSTPMTLLIDPSSACTFKCKFCPNGDNDLIKSTGRWQGQMDFDLYKKIIDDIGEFDKPLKILRLYKDGEPLLNKNFHKMVKYAKDSGYINSIDTTTNGFLINSTTMKSIIDDGLNRINISVNGVNDLQYLKFTGVHVNFNKYVKNIMNLYKVKGDCEIVIKINGDYLTDDDKQLFYNIFGDYCDKIFIENTAPCWPEFDVEAHTGVRFSKTKGIYNNELTDVTVCPYIFYMLSINSDGTVSLCFLDWARKLIIGDTKKQSIKEIWDGDLLYEYRMNNLYGRKKYYSTCKNCGQLKYGIPDNIDQYANFLIDKLKNKKY